MILIAGPCVLESRDIVMKIAEGLMPYFNDSIRLPAKPSGIERILLVRTFIPLAAGGPVPPVGLLYIASAVRKRFGNALEIKLFDTGLTKKPVEEFREILLKFKPGVVGFSSMSCEADFLGELAGIAAKQSPTRPHHATRLPPLRANSASPGIVDQGARTRPNRRS